MDEYIVVTVYVNYGLKTYYLYNVGAESDDEAEKTLRDMSIIPKNERTIARFKKTEPTTSATLTNNERSNMDEIDTIQLTLDEIKAHLPQRVSLYYVDYRDSLENSLEEIQQAIQEQDWMPLDDLTNEWWIEDDGTQYYLDELYDDIAREYDIDKEDARDAIEEYVDDIRGILYERDDSTPLHDLFCNTGDIVCFYDLGLDVPGDSWAWSEEDMREELEAVKVHLQIDSDKYDSQLFLMLAQACSSGSGRLVVYFVVPGRDIEDMVIVGDYNTIQFKNPMVAVIDTYNGSGDHTDLPGHSMSFAWDAHNLFLDKTIKYSYTYEVCGMYSDWCGCTDIKFVKVDCPDTIKPSSLHAENEVEKLYIEAYKKGGCTAGDMDQSRHRDVFYLNEFPCGEHCPHCGTFWID